MASAELWRCSKASERCASRRRARRRRGAKRTNDAQLPRRRARRSPRTSSRCCRTHRVNSSTRSRARSTRRRSAPEPRSRAPPRRERAKASWIRKTSSPSSPSTRWSGAPNVHPATANAPSYAPPSVSRPSLASVPPAPPSSPARHSVIIIDRIHHIAYVRAPPRASIPSRRPPRRSLAPSRPLPLQSSHESIQTIDCTFKQNICSFLFPP